MTWVQQNVVKGPQGPQGDKGDTGSTGLQGATGGAGWDWSDGALFEFDFSGGPKGTASQSYTAESAVVIHSDHSRIIGPNSTGKFEYADRFAGNMYGAMKLIDAGWYLFNYTVTTTNKATIKLHLKLGTSLSNGAMDSASWTEVETASGWNSASMTILRWRPANSFVWFYEQFGEITTVYPPEIRGSIMKL